MNSKKVVVNSVIYTACNLIMKAFNFFLLPLYTAYLTTSDYGITNIATSFQNVASYLVAFSLYSAVVRFYADYKKNTETLRKFYSSVICFVFLSSVCFFALMLFFRDLLVRTIFKDIPFFPTVLIILSSLCFYSLYTLYQEILKGMQKSLKSAITSVAYFFVQLGLNILFVVYLKWGANGVLIANLVSGVVFTVFMLADMIKNGLFCVSIDLPILKSALKYSVPLLPHNLATQITQLVSKIFINSDGTLSAVGIYGVSSQFGHIADLFLASFHSAFQPWFFEKMNQGGNENTSGIKKLSDTLLWVFGLLFIGLSLFSQEAILLMTSESFHSSWKYVPFIVAAFALKMPYYFYVTILFYHKESTKKIFYATLTSSLVNMVLSYLLISPFGIYGSILADLLAMILRVTIIVFLCRRYNDVNYNIASMLLKSAIIIGFCFGGLFFGYTKFKNVISLENILFKCGVILVYMIFVYALNRQEINSMVQSFLYKFHKEKRK